MSIKTHNIPAELVELPQWVCWKMVLREGEETKVPFQSRDSWAKSNDPSTWMAFSEASALYAGGGFDGVGFMFSKDDPYCGIDLDGCRNPETGIVADWARDIVLRFGSYAEVSPSQTGIKIWCRGVNPTDRHKVAVNTPPMCSKTPAIEIYDRLRYFAVTGMRLQGRSDVTDGAEALAWLAASYFPNATVARPSVDFRSNDAVVLRARKYLSKLPPAISGAGGHNATFHAACVLVLGFELSENDAMELMHEYNQTCQPAWSERELRHKVSDAAKQPGERGYLRNANPDRWPQIKIPSYHRPAPPIASSVSTMTTIVEASKKYLDSIRDGQTSLIDLGINELDYALGGGVEKGEMVIFAARPSHGKSAVALQLVHHWSSLKMPCLIISEEMSSLALGKRTVQFVSDIPQEHWSDLVGVVETQIDEYAESRAPCYIAESCGSADNAARVIEKAVADHGVECVVVDYAQLLSSQGKTRYEQVTNTSMKLRQIASSQKIVLLVLCQLSRGIESRDTFAPIMSDLKDTGQLEQDADVITFLVWPWRIKPEENKRGTFQFFIAKNRNRAINQPAIECQFNPERQKILESEANAKPPDWDDERRCFKRSAAGEF